MTHMDTAARATRWGRDSLGVKGGDSTSSNHRPIPTGTRVTASTATSQGCRASALTAGGVLQSTAPARYRPKNPTLLHTWGCRRRPWASQSTGGKLVTAVAVAP